MVPIGSDWLKRGSEDPRRSPAPLGLRPFASDYLHHRNAVRIQISIFLFLGFVISPCRAAEPLPSGPPDILLIYTDDHRADALGCAGNAQLRTPNIDRLADRGTLFQCAYLSGSDSGALCMPSRAMLMTGRNFPRIRREGGWNLAPQATCPPSCASTAIAPT
jgi:hypothetical protein